MIFYQKFYNYHLQSAQPMIYLLTMIWSNSKFHFDKEFRLSPLPCGNLLVYQIGELYCGNSLEIKDHQQWCYEFTYVLDGKGTVYTDGVPSPVKKHDCYWSAYNDIHRIVSDADSPLRFIYIGYTTKETEIRNIHSLLFEKNKLLPNMRVFSSAALHDDFLKAVAETSNTNHLSPYMLGLIIKMIIIKSFRLLMKSDTPVYAFDPKDPSHVAYQIANYIDQNILDITSLSDLTSIFYFNYQYLARVFKKIMNTSINEYFINKKMEKAVELLAAPGMSVTRVAETLKYSSIHSFSHAFEKFFGISPKKYHAKPNE